MSSTIARLSVVVSLFACGDAGPGGSGEATTTSTTGETGASSSAGSSGTGEASTTGPTTTSTTGTSDDPTGAGTTGAVGPAIPTGFELRWPPPGPLLCDSQYPTAVFVHGGELFVGTSCGEVFRSSDAGASWTPTPTPATPAQPLPNGLSAPISDFVAAGERLFVSYRGGSGIFVTSDGGDGWAPFVAGLSGMYGKVVLDMHVAGGTLYAASFGAGVHASGVDAPAFVAVNTETSDPALQSPSSTCPNTPGYLDPVTDQPMTFLHGFSLADDGEYLYYGNKCGGIYRTPLAGLPQQSAWEGFGAGLPFFDAYYQDPFAIASDGAAIYAGIDDEGAYRTAAKQPAAWTWITQQGLVYDKIDPLVWMFVGDAVYMGAAFGGVYVTTTQGSPWTDLNQLPGGKIGNGAETVYDLAHDAAHVYVAAETGLYVSVP